MAHAVKHDGQHKARLVAGGHLAETPIDSACSSVVSSRGARLLAFTGELNGLKIFSTDIGNACLEMHTEEKVHVIAGPEFGDREGHALILSKALCGLHSSGLHWSERLADVLREMGFFTSKCEKDDWMRDKGDHCEHIVACVDHLVVASKDPDSITTTLMEKCQFKLKGTGPAEFHLHCDFFCGEEGAPCHAPKKHVEQILENCRRIFGAWPKQPCRQSMVIILNWTLRSCSTKTIRRCIRLQLELHSGQLRQQRCLSHFFAPCQQEGTLTTSRESMGVFPRCAMLQTRSGLTHLTVPMFRSRCMTGNAPAVQMQMKRFLWMLPNQKESW